MTERKTQTLKMIQLCLTFLIPGLVSGQLLGFGGLPGQRTPRTGSVWPPYTGAGLGYWARQAGYYKKTLQPQIQLVKKQIQPAHQQIMSAQQEIQSYQPIQPVVKQEIQPVQQSLVPIYQQSQNKVGSNTAPLQYTFPSLKFDSDKIRQRQKLYMGQYLVSSNEVEDSSDTPAKPFNPLLYTLFRFSTKDGSLTPVSSLP